MVYKCMKKSSMASSDSFVPERSMQFGKYVVANKLKLPLLVRVTETSQQDIVAGDLLKLLYVWEKCEAKYEDPESHRKMRVIVPSDLGGFKTVSQYPQDHVYSSVQEMALDFPPSVRVLEDVQIQNTLVKSGDGLKLVSMKNVGKNQYIFCRHYPSNNPLLVPLNLRSKFQRRKDDTVYTVEELKTRMPVQVQRERDVGATIRSSNEQVTPGFPEEFEGIMMLTKSTVVQAEHWQESKSDQICKRNRVFTIEENFSVSSAECLQQLLGPVKDVTKVAREAHRVGNTRPNIVMICSTEQTILDVLGIPPYATVSIHGSERKKGVILRGVTSYFLVPKDYDKSVLFRLKGKEYATPFELWKSNHTEEVTAMQTIQCLPEGCSELASVYQMDKVQLVRERGVAELQRYLKDDEDEVEVVELIRTYSNAKAYLGTILVEANANVNFEEPPSVVGQHCLSDILRYDSIPMDIALCSVSLIDEISEENMQLLCDSPFTVLKECEYNVTYISIFNNARQEHPTTTQTFEIPEFMDIQVRQVQGVSLTDDVKRSFQTSMSRLFRLSEGQYRRLVVKKTDDVLYEDIDDSPFSPNHNNQQSRHMSRTPPQPSHDMAPFLTLSKLQSSSMTALPARLPPKPKPRHRSVPPTPPRPSTSTLPLNRYHSVAQSSHQSKLRRALSDSGQPLPSSVHPPEEAHVYAELTGERTNQIPLKTLDIPIVFPPPDGVITEFDVMQMAGLMRHLGFRDHAVSNCINDQINGQKLCDIFRSMEGHAICKALKLDKMSDVYSLQHFVNKSEMAAMIPKVEPPEDGDISHFSVKQLAGLMRHLGFKEKTVSICLAKQIDGMELCGMNRESVRVELGLDTSDSDFYALQHFIAKSLCNNAGGGDTL